MVRKILFIVNPASETIDNKNLGSMISGFAEKYTFKWKVYYTEKTCIEANIRENIREYNPNTVVAAGGDGTVNLVASQIIGSDIDLGIIPAGSANGLAYNLNIPADFEEALKIVLTADAKPIDVVQLNNENYSLHLSDVGINARIVKRFEKEGSKGLLGYGKQMFKELFSKRSDFSFTIDISGNVSRYTAEMLVIANARCFGTGAIINPAGQLDDGEFEIIIIRPYPWWILFYLFRMFLFGKLEKLKYIQLIKAGKAEINFDNPHDLQADGEIISGVKELKISVISSALKIRH